MNFIHLKFNCTPINPVKKFLKVKIAIKKNKIVLAEDDDKSFMLTSTLKIDNIDNIIDGKNCCIFEFKIPIMIGINNAMPRISKVTANNGKINPKLILTL